MYSNGLSWLLMTAFKNLRCKFFVDFKLYKWKSADKVSTLKNHKFVIINYCFQVIKSGSVKLSWKYHNTFFIYDKGWYIFVGVGATLFVNFFLCFFFQWRCHCFYPKSFYTFFLWATKLLRLKGLNWEKN